MSLFGRTNNKGILRRILGWLALAGLLVASFFLTLAPTPYLVEKPGPVYNVLATVGGKPMINIPDRKTYPTEGTLDLLTVSISGDPVRGASWLELLQAYFTPSNQIIDIADIYPPGVDSSEIDKEADVMMLDSQAAAKAAALRELGENIPSSVRVSVVQKDGPAWGKLKAGDTLLTIDGDKATGIDQVRAKVAESEGKRPVVLEILREGEAKTVSLIPVSVDGKWRMGIFVATVPEIPINIDIQVGNVGGPSGGQIFALAIYDLLTPGSLSGGNKIAGTGTIDVDGTIGAIGGIKQKMYGARDAGAKYFLAPAVNCPSVKGNIPSGIQVIKVETLKDSIKALQAISAGKAKSLPSCN